MIKPRHIPRPKLNSATHLTPMQLNAMACETKHTLLTPELLERMARENSMMQDANAKVSE